jgi:hypothetical protein
MVMYSAVIPSHLTPGPSPRRGEKDMGAGKGGDEVIDGNDPANREKIMELRKKMFGK